MIPVVGNDIQILFGHQRSLRPHISSLFFFIFNPALHCLNHFCPFGHQQRKPLADYIHRSEQFHLPAELVVISLFNIFQIFQIFCQFLFFVECRAIDPLQHSVIRIPSPISARRGDQLKRFDPFCTHQVGAGAKIHKVPLLIKGNHCILRQIPDQLHFIRLALFLHKLHGFFPGQSEFLQFFPLFDYFFHFRFQLIQIFPGKRGMFKIVIKSGINTRADRQLRIGIKPLYCLRQHMGSRMSHHLNPLFIVSRQYIKLAVAVHHRPKIHRFPVYFSRTGRPCQPFADIRRDIDHAHGRCILLFTSIF